MVTGWRGSLPATLSVEKGDIVNLRGTIKAHKEFNGVYAKPRLTRCKVLETACGLTGNITGADNRP